MEQQTSNQYSKKWNIPEKAEKPEKPDRSNKKKEDPVILVQILYVNAKTGK